MLALIPIRLGAPANSVVVDLLDQDTDGVSAVDEVRFAFDVCKRSRLSHSHQCGFAPFGSGCTGPEGIHPSKASGPELSASSSEIMDPETINNILDQMDASLLTVDHIIEIVHGESIDGTRLVDSNV
jgi:hypothetical protein